MIIGAQISHGRLRRDTLKYAAGFRYKLGIVPDPFLPSKGGEAIISPMIFLHLPNCIQYIPLYHGTIAANLTL